MKKIIAVMVLSFWFCTSAYAIVLNANQLNNINIQRDIVVQTWEVKEMAKDMTYRMAMIEANINVLRQQGLTVPSIVWGTTLTDIGNAAIINWTNVGYGN